jgi:hypothetical protein
LRAYAAANFDEEIGDLKADFILSELGLSVDNRRTVASDP